MTHIYTTSVLNQKHPLFIDFLEAFDSINHERYGVREADQKLNETYLQN